MFQCESDMMATMHQLTMAMIWWGEPVMLCILPPNGRQVRDYIATRSSHQSGTQTHVHSRGLAIWPVPGMPSLEKGPSGAQASTTQAELTRDVWDLDDDQLWGALEALQT